MPFAIGQTEDEKCLAAPARIDKSKPLRAQYLSSTAPISSK